MKTFTLYGLRKPGEEIRYIGITHQTPKDRLKRHLKKEPKETHKTLWILKMRRDENLRPEIVQYCVGLTEAEAKELETQVISSLRQQGVDLVNTSDGGEGTFGYRHTEAARKKMSETRSGENHWGFGKRGEASPNFGRKASPQARANMSAAQKGNKNNLGKKQSLEAIEKTRQANLGRKRSPEARRKMSLAQMGNKKRSGQPVSAGTRQRISQAKKGKKISSSGPSEKRSSAMLLRWEKKRQEAVLAVMWK